MEKCPPYRAIEDAVDPNDLLGEFSMSAARVIKASRGHAYEIERDLERQAAGDRDTKNYLDEGTSEDIELAIENLTKRIQTLFGCIVPDASEESLANFSHDLKIRTDTMEKVMEDVARSKLLLSRMIYRYGMALQIKLDGEELLTPEMKLELKESDKKVAKLFEQ